MTEKTGFSLIFRNALGLINAVVATNSTEAEKIVQERTTLGDVFLSSGAESEMPKLLKQYRQEGEGLNPNFRR